MFKNNFITIAAVVGSLALLFHVSIAKAGTSTRFISFKAGSQYFDQDIEIARTKAEQNERTNVYGISIETRLPVFTWGLSVIGFENEWKTKIPSTRTDGHYKVLTISLDIKKSLRLYKDLFFYGGGGIGISRIESHYTKDTYSQDDSGALLTVLGNIGIEWRFDTNAIFLDSQWFRMDGSGSSGSSKYDRYPSSNGPRIMLGVGFFF